MRRFEPWLVNGMALLAVFVQLAVYGATKIRSHGALLGIWAPYFRVPYGIAFLVLQLCYCRSCRHPRGIRYILVTWAVRGAVFLVSAATKGRRFYLGECTALSAGLSALVLWAAFHEGRM